MGLHHVLATATPLPPEMIRRTAEEVVKQPKFKLDLSEGYDFAALAERAVEWIGNILRPLSKLLHPLWVLSPLLWWAVVLGLSCLLVLLLAHIVHAFASSIRERRYGGLTAQTRQREEELPDTWEGRARQALQAGDHILAVRCLFRAGLLRLIRARRNAPRLGATNREYLRFFRQSPLLEPLEHFVGVIDRWYGGGECSQEEYERCAQAYDLIRRNTDLAEANR